MAQPTIVLAGAAADLGTRIAKALVARGAAVRALVRVEVSAGDRDRLTGMGAIVAPAAVSDIGSVAAACAGAACVVSALNGLHDVIVDRQGVLLDGAVKAGVPRFISSDYSADFTKTRPGDNRNFDLRREFMARADRAPIKVTSILSGAFMDMLGAEMPIVQPRIHRVLYWGDVNQPLDFTTKNDVAAYVAAAALDDTAPRILRIAGDTLSARDIAADDGEGDRQALSHIAGGRRRLARCAHPSDEVRRAATARGIPAVAGHAIHARHVQRARQAPPARQRPLCRDSLGVGQQRAG